MATLLEAYLAIALLAGWIVYLLLDPYGHLSYTTGQKLWRATLYGLGWPFIVSWLLILCVYDWIRNRL